jgi:hypothetical protein
MLLAVFIYRNPAQRRESAANRSALETPVPQTAFTPVVDTSAARFAPPAKLPGAGVGPLARQILGEEYLTCPTAQILTPEFPDMSEKELVFIRSIYDAEPRSRTDLAVLSALIESRTKASAAAAAEAAPPTGVNGEGLVADNAAAVLANNAAAAPAPVVAAAPQASETAAPPPPPLAPTAVRGESAQ